MDGTLLALIALKGLEADKEARRLGYRLNKYLQKIAAMLSHRCNTGSPKGLRGTESDRKPIRIMPARMEITKKHLHGEGVLLCNKNAPYGKQRHR